MWVSVDCWGVFEREKKEKEKKHRLAQLHGTAITIHKLHHTKWAVFVMTANSIPRLKRKCELPFLFEVISTSLVHEDDNISFENAFVVVIDVTINSKLQKNEIR